MALPSLATTDDVELLLGGTPDNEDQVEALLRLASARARAYTGCRWANEAGDALADVPDGVTEVVAGMVVRAVQNPRGVTQETIGPASVSYGSDAASRIYLTAGDKEILDANRCKSRLWVLSPTRCDLETPDVSNDLSRFESPFDWDD